MAISSFQEFQVHPGSNAHFLLASKTAFLFSSMNVLVKKLILVRIESCYDFNLLMKNNKTFLAMNEMKPRNFRIPCQNGVTTLILNQP